MEYSTSDELVRSGKSNIEVDIFFQDIRSYFKAQEKLKLRWNNSIKKLYTNRTVLEQIMLNLVSNAVKHGNNSVAVIQVNLEEDKTHYLFSVGDNGPGIPAENRREVFELFRSFAATRSGGEKSHGIGLATVKKLVELSGGVIGLQSTVGKGSTFRFSLKK